MKLVAFPYKTPSYLDPKQGPSDIYQRAVWREDQDPFPPDTWSEVEAANMDHLISDADYTKLAKAVWAAHNGGG